MQFKLRLIIPLSLILLAIVQGILLYIFNYKAEIKRLENYFTLEVVGEANRIQGILEILLAQNNQLEVRNVISFQTEKKNIKYATLIDEQGLISASTRFASIDRQWRLGAIPNAKIFNEETYLKNLNKVKNTLRNSSWISQDKQSLFLIFPIVNTYDEQSLRANKVDFLIEEYDLGLYVSENVQLIKRNLIYEISGLLVLAIFFSILVNLLFSNRVSKLISTTTNFKEGDYSSRCKVKGKDEIGQLGVAFDLMADQIEEERNMVIDSQKMYQTIAEGAPVGVFKTDTEGNCLYVNPRWQQLTGLTFEKALGQGWVKVLHPDDSENVFQQWQEAVNNKKLFEMEYRFLHQNGDVYWVYGQAIAEMDPENKITGYTGTVTDITERKLAEIEIELYRDHLEELVKERTSDLEVEKQRVEIASSAKTEFLSRMSHELRTPLNAILGFSQLLLMDDDVIDEKYISSIKEIEIAGRHLLDMVDEILDIQRIELGRYIFDFTNEDLASILDLLLDMLSLQLTKKNIRVSISDNIQNGVLLYTDKNLLIKILNNLITNAIKYNKDNGEIIITYDSLDRKSVITVEDTGEGIADEDLDNVFEPFDRLTHAGDIQGTGIGLTIVKQIVSLLNGKIEVKSVKGKGSVFTVTLPNDIERK